MRAQLHEGKWYPGKIMSSKASKNEKVAKAEEAYEQAQVRTLRSASVTEQYVLGLGVTI